MLRHNRCSRGHPAEVIAYDCETRGAPTPERPSVLVELKVGRAVWKCLRRGTRVELDFYSASEFWDFVEARALRKRLLWVVAHNAKNFDLAVLEWERQLTERGWKISGRPVLPTDGPGPLKVVARKDGKAIVLADLANWYGPTPLESIGHSVGCEKADLGSEAEKQAILRAEPDSPLWGRLMAYMHQDVEVVLRALEVWIDFLRRFDLGNFSASVAGQAMQAFRHRFMNQDIFIHNNPVALELEREAYCGALVDCYLIGEREGEFHMVDVNSEYPFVMRERRFPVKLLGVRRRPGVAELRRLLADGYAVIARVKIEADRALVPTVQEGRLVWPVGRFTTTLCTGELQRALEADQVRAVDCLAVYKQERVFVDYVDFFFSQRRVFQEAQDEAFAHCCKLFLNALYGKFGQRNYEWEEAAGRLPEPGTVTIAEFENPKDADLEQRRRLDNWPALSRYIRGRGGLQRGDFSRVDIPGSLYRRGGAAPDVVAQEMVWELPEAMGLWNPEDGAAAMLSALQRAHAEHLEVVRAARPRMRVRHLRQLGSLLQVRSERKVEGHDSFCAIAAHCTSYARLVIQEYRRRAGLEHTYYVDTDSLLVDRSGLEALKPVMGSELGELKLEWSGIWIDIKGPKNYACRTPWPFWETPHKVRHKGRRKDADPLPDGAYRQVQFRGLAGAFRARDPNHAMISLVVKRADQPYRKGIVRPDGRTRPLELALW